MVKVGVIAGLLAVAVSSAQQREPDIVVFVHTGNESAKVIGIAEEIATGMMASAGVSVRWAPGRAEYRGQAETIEVILTKPSDTFMPGTLAFTNLGIDRSINIFYDRIRHNHCNAEVAPILAHVLVHELTHVLEGVKRHAANGVMKAHWDSDDFLRMRRSPLPFTNEDLGLIREWATRHDQMSYAL